MLEYGKWYRYRGRGCQAVKDFSSIHWLIRDKDGFMEVAIYDWEFGWITDLDVYEYALIPDEIQW